MATIPYFEPQWVRNTLANEPEQLLYAPAPGQFWRRGSFLIPVTTGSIVAPPGGVGTLATTPGPAASAVTLSYSASAGAPGGSSWVILTYRGASTAESLPSQEFIVNVPPGNVLTAIVSATGAPALATNFAAYVSQIPGFELLQGTVTALGSTFTASNPLADSTGVGQAATNVAGSIAGMAINDSNENFYAGPGGSTNVGSQSLMGSTNSLPPLTPLEPPLDYVLKLNACWIEMNLRQTIPYYPSLIGTQVGLYLDATSGWFVADTSQSNKVATIVQQAAGVPGVQGSYGDLGARVVVQFIASTLL